MKVFVVGLFFVLSVEKGGPCMLEVLLAKELVLVDCESLPPEVLVYFLSGAEAGNNPPNLLFALLDYRLITYDDAGILTVGDLLSIVELI